MKRRLRPVLFLLMLAAAAAADVKITTRSTVMGRSSQSTVYIKGARQRSEDAGGNVSILQCDKRRMIVVDTRRNTCTVLPLGANGMPAGSAMEAAVAARAVQGAPRKGGTVTVTTTSHDTGERQKMFGFEARHLTTKTVIQSSPDACYPMNMSTEGDGWYADLSVGLNCSAGMGMGAMAAARPECVDHYRYAGEGMGRLGFPLKQTTTMEVMGHPMTSTSEVTDLSTATLPDSLFEEPAGCREVTLGEATAEAAPPAPAPEAAPAAPAPAPAPTAPPAPSIPAKAAGVVRVGVVGLKDLTNQSLPTDNLRVLLIGEIRNRQVDAVPLDSTERQALEEEARSKDCDYILFTDLGQMDQGPEAKLPAQLHTIPITGEGDYLGRVDWQLFRTGKTVPQWKTSEAARNSGLGVNAVGDSVVKEAGAVVEEIQHPHKAAPAPAPAPRRKGK
ncbi:MAG TPA: hypothetical protein VEG08_14915 [Terriglobales bacterium]|nr:hypothetical protein [Terriglobales bacterium]